MKPLHLPAAMIAAALAAGCANKTCCSGPCGHEAAFFPEEDRYVIQRVAAQQAASAARQNATLSDVHFNGTGLNSLGEQRLILMLGDDDISRPLTIYLDCRQDQAARHDAVLVFMQSCGLDAAQVHVTAGANPDSTSPAAPLLKHQEKLEPAAAAN